ncbi:cell differentiation protein rcd1 [Vairimorpha ceranae]|uniref:Cell differentiation protein rcd1 n=1 Tax=Vairimorpha ceranae TaxID=40302 RepID=A0A0F9ZFX0_9MICR|nr:cell differentiation protein rcd1 [Vairimorpha ceranae]KAF5141008.1 hypothetical protein G9O61_00g008520 [Vairimorpha ceranae]KAF5141516.1 hypothetical protein G9O61_00g003800 [Vairimorpha ceranae]KKO76264.1 cell differentiation protein rcd1 [Vairimorpha ceranae]
MNKKKDLLYQEITETCSNSIKDSNKKIYLEKILKYLTDSASPLYIWEQNGIPILILQELIEPYTSLQSFTKEISDNLSTVLQILYYLVQNNEIKKAVVDARFHFYLFRYVTIYDIAIVYETPRIWVLKTFRELVTDQYVQSQVKNTEMVPILLKNIDLGSNDVKLLSMETFYNLISGDEGLKFVTQTFDRFSAINQVFNSISRTVCKSKTYSIIKLILQVYIRLCSKPHIKQAVANKLPENVISEEMKCIVEDNKECKELYEKLVSLINKN